MLANLFRKNIPRWPTQRHFADVAERRADAIVAPSRRYSILVAEANPAKQEVVAELVESTGHCATIVEDGEAALDALNQREFDLVLMNVDLPVMNGIDAIKLYRFTSLGRPRVPIVALTADATKEVEHRCKEANIDACITEPIEPDRLLGLIGTLVRNAGKDQQSSSNANETADYSSARPGSRAFSVEAIDLHTLNALEGLGGPEFVNELAAEFLDDATGILRDLTEFMASGDVQAICMRVHALRSAASNIGARRIYEMCLTWGQIAPEDLASLAETFLNDLREEFARARVALQELLSERNAAAGRSENAYDRLGKHAVHTE